MPAWDLCILGWMEHWWKRGSDNCYSPCLALSHSNLASLSQLPACLSFAVKTGISFRGSFSCQSFTLTGTICCNLFQWHSQLVPFGLWWRALICCNLVSLSAVVSAVKHSSWQVLISSIGSLNRASAPISLLRFLNFSCFARLSLPALPVPSSYRQSESAVKQDLCRLLYSACLHNC